MSISDAPDRSVSEVVSSLQADSTSALSIDARIQLCRACIEGVYREASQWADDAVRAKRLPKDSPLRAEDILSGPAVVARQLQLTIQTLNGLKHQATPRLPGTPHRLSNGQVAVPVFPTRGYFDSLTFMGLQGHVRMQPGVDPADIHGRLPDQVRDGRITGITGILGAGNVSSIPATDSLCRILFEGRRVVLKTNPVNEYLAPIFERAFAPLIDASLLKIMTGGPDTGAAMVQHPDVSEVHITGSTQTHDAIVWGSDPEERDRRKQAGDPLLKKTITSELGNVTPWIITPGVYSSRQLKSQAQHVAASITNNASFNCLATKVIITWDQWAQREEFLTLVQHYLDQTPRRPAYYPGATERYCRYSNTDTAPDDNGTLPWTLLPEQSIDERPELFEEESFVCVCAETSLSADSPAAFLLAATDFVNDRMTGTLCASVTLPSGFKARDAATVDQCLERLRYGSVCINQWSGLAYGFTSPPWGAWPGATIEDVQSGIGSVHNTFLVDQFEKTVLAGPLVNFPKPIWFPSHRKAAQVALKLLDLYHRPSPFRLPALFAAALTG